MEGFIEESVRERLIIAGIEELRERGVQNFSLRRAALSAQVSCAAPYRHFKDKNEYILEIINYICSRWQLLSREIERAYADNGAKRGIELAVAYIRFWNANPNFRSVLLIPKSESISGVTFEKFDEAFLRATDEYSKEKGLSEEEAELKKYSLRALIYGTVMLMETGELKNDCDTLDLLRKKLENEFK